MQKRIWLYGGTILWTLALFIVLSDRHVTERVPMLESLLTRVIVIIGLSSLLGMLIRAVAARRRSARAG